MKSIGELTETEALKLRFAQAHLKDAASDFVLARALGKSHSGDHLDVLFSAAREFDATCRDIGIDEYWQPMALATHHCCPS